MTRLRTALLLGTLGVAVPLMSACGHYHGHVVHHRIVHHVVHHVIVHHHYHR